MIESQDEPNQRSMHSIQQSDTTGSDLLKQIMKSKRQEGHKKGLSNQVAGHRPAKYLIDQHFALD